MKVAFVCVHNSCRSQIAEAFCKVIGLGVCESYSAGTQLANQINEKAITVMKEIGVDMNMNQYPKRLQAIPEVDIVITMGCNVDCPRLICRYREDWGLDDPSGKELEDFRRIRKNIHDKVIALVKRIQNGEIK